MIDPTTADNQGGLDYSLWSEAYARYLRLWINLARTTMITREEAEDIVHGVVSSLLMRSDKQFESIEHIRNYVARSVLNRGIQLRQRGARLVDITETTEIMMFREARSNASSELPDRTLLNIIKTLPENDFVIIKLRFFAGFTFKEIRELLDLPISTLKSRELAALRRIRKALMNYDN